MSDKKIHIKLSPQEADTLRERLRCDETGDTLTLAVKKHFNLRELTNKGSSNEEVRIRNSHR